jgi:hypothetical protein
VQHVEKPGKGRSARAVYFSFPREQTSFVALFVEAVVKVSVRGCRFRSGTTLP